MELFHMNPVFAIIGGICTGLIGSVLFDRFFKGD